jgi:ZIP family zinc transporter
MGESALGLMLGFVSGVLLYVSSSHLLPEAREHEKKHSAIAFIAGIGLSFFIVLTRLL